MNSRSLALTVGMDALSKSAGLVTNCLYQTPSFRDYYSMATQSGVNRSGNNSSKGDITFALTYRTPNTVWWEVFIPDS